MNKVIYDSSRVHSTREWNSHSADRSWWMCGRHLLLGCQRDSLGTYQASCLLDALLWKLSYFPPWSCLIPFFIQCLLSRVSLHHVPISSSSIPITYKVILPFIQYFHKILKCSNSLRNKYNKWCVRVSFNIIRGSIILAFHFYFKKL